MNHRLSPLNHIINHRIDITPAHIDRSDWPEAGLEQCVEWSAVAVYDMGEILLVRRISTTLLDGIDHHNFH
jgi:hypothetical protein